MKLGPFRDGTVFVSSTEQQVPRLRVRPTAKHAVGENADAPLGMTKVEKRMTAQLKLHPFADAGSKCWLYGNDRSL